MPRTPILILTAASLLRLQAQSPVSLDSHLAGIANWKIGQSRESMRAISEAVQKVQTSEAQKREIEKRFLAFLQSNASLGSKDFVSRELSVIASGASITPLSAMLVRADTADMARFVLERVPGADRALRDALAKTSGRVRLGIIDSLGKRRDAASVAALRPLAASSDSPTASAALSALAEIADSSALTALEQIVASSSGPARQTVAEALLKAADNRVARGDARSALPVYQRMYAAGEPSVIRAGALNGIVAADPQPAPVLLEALRGEDPRLQSIAITTLTKSAPKQLLAEIPKLPETARVRIFAAMAERRETSALPVLLTSSKDPSQPVRLAALEAIGAVGDASVIAALASIAAGSEEAERTAARASLAAIPGKEADLKIVEQIPAAPPNVRLELIRAAGARGATAAAPVLLKLARESDGDVRRESLRGLRETASGAEVAGLAALIPTLANPSDREEAGRDLSAALRRSDGARVADVISAYNVSGDSAARAVLLQTLGPGGTAAALPLLRAALKEDQPDLKRAAILALNEWPDGTGVPDLLGVARSAANPAHQVLALRGAIRLIALPSPPRTPQESVKLLSEAMSLAKQAEEKRAVLAQLPKYPVREALDLARASLSDPQVSAEAKTAANRLENALVR